MKRSQPANSSTGSAPAQRALVSRQSRVEWTFRLAAFAAPLVIFWLTLAPSVTLEDSGEFITGAYQLGVLHPPGFPTWCVLAHLATLIPLGSVAERVNLFSALCGAATCLGLYLIARRLSLPPLASLLGAWALACSAIFWSQSNVAEVYTLHTLFFVLLVWLALGWRDELRPLWLACFALALGLGVGNHILLGSCAPPIAIWMLCQAPRVALRPRVVAGCIALLLLGLSIYAYLPLRARANPPLNWGNPQTLAQTWSHVRRDVYLGESGRQGGSASDLARHITYSASQTVESFTYFLAPLAVIGLLWFWRHERSFLLMLAGVVVCNILLLNVLVRAEFSPIWAFAHRVYYLPVHAIYALLLAAGFEQTCAWINRRWPKASRWTGTAFIVLFVPLAQFWHHNDRHSDLRARYLALDLVASLPPGAGILPIDDLATFSVLYLTQVEHLRPDIQLLKPDFGFRGGPVSAIFSNIPASEALAQIFPTIAGWQSQPHGLGYLLLPPDARVASDYADFKPLTDLTQTWSSPPDTFDPFDLALRSLYSVYHARLGAMHLARRQPDQAANELAQAEALSGDPFDFYLLAKIRLDLNWEKDRAAELLTTALQRYDERTDRQSQVLSPVTREQILALAQLAPQPPP
jgi:hypothetical protein